jgi:prepilin-type processing-associated H-X9-DG protein
MSEPRDDERSGAPVAPQPVMPVVDYSTPAPQNACARRAMLFAALGFVPFVPGILAIVTGRRGLRDAEADPKIGGRRMARTAIMLGVASVVVWTILSILAVPAAARARRQALRVQCASNLRQMGVAAMIYATANTGLLPPNIDALTTSGIPARLFTCPACAGDPTKPVSSTGAFGSYHYVYLGNGQQLSTIRRPSTVPLVYEPLSNHTDPGINVLFMDGHVELLQGGAATAILQQGAAVTTQPALEVER